MDRPAHFLLLVLGLTAIAGPARADVPANGWVVWSSNRQDGRHEIYLMKADGTGVTRLTQSGGTFPGWAPDGKWIAYNHSDGFAHVMRHTGSSDKKICDGPFEFWLWDKSGLVCKQGDSHYKINPDNGTKTLLFSKSDFSRFGTNTLSAGGITANGRYLVAGTDLYRNGYTGNNGSFTAYHAAVILDFQDKSTVYYFGSGCEPNTPPSGDLIYHVCGGGACSTFPDPYKMNLADLATRSSYQAEIAHADADWGHEYFPRISNDNVWMVYGATTGCHDHDTCDYEIWVHRLGAGNTNRTRITTNPANDQWPHLFVGTLAGCITAGDCSDSNPCTTDSCSSGSCQHAAISGCCTASSDCNDNNLCTSDSCTSNKCQHSAVSGCCTASSQCDDGSVCTTDICSASKCQHSAISGCCTSASQCDDSNSCTTDSCTSNKCQHSAVSGCCTTSSQCGDSNPCTTDSCEVSTGKCSNQSASGCCAVDTDCDDASACSLDKCESNKCQHSAISGCCTADSHCDDNNPCTTDSCDVSTGKCSSQSTSGCCAYDTDCDDADPCSLDKCVSNQCQHSPICGGDAGADGGTDATSGADGGLGTDGALARASTGHALVGGCSLVPARPFPAFAPWLLLWLGLGLWLLGRRRGRRGRARCDCSNGRRGC